MSHLETSLNRMKKQGDELVLGEMRVKIESLIKELKHSSRFSAAEEKKARDVSKEKLGLVSTKSC